MFISDQFSNRVRGMVYIVLGVVLLLHTLGILQQGVTIILSTLSVGMILYGMVLLRVYEYIKLLMQKRADRKETDV